ncbi:MAG: efflux RND transporter periplasmic adaptor subunit [Sphingomonas sp.]
MTFKFAVLPLLLALALTACGGSQSPAENHAEAEQGHGEEGAIALTPQQIATAGIELTHPSIGGSGGVIELPATIEGDPQGTRVVSAAIGGRVVALTRNLGETVRRGDTLAIIESQDAAALNAEVEKARARAGLARSNLARDEALLARGFRAKRDVDISRAAAREADVALAQAQQQVAAAGISRGSLNRIVITAPISGQVIGRSAVLGQTFEDNAELFRVANLSRLSVTLSLPPGEASRVKPGMTVEIVAGDRRQTGKVTFVSPVLDPQTRQVPVIAMLDNRGGIWRVGESVTARVLLPADGDGAIRVPSTAVQTVEGRTVVFVRTATGFQATPITLGRQDGAMVVVTAGLTGREQIAATNSFTLKSALGASEAGHED